MTNPWFLPETARLLSLLSLLSLCSLAAIPAKRGHWRRIVTSVWNVAISFGCALLVAGALAAMSGQPPYVSRALVLTGIVVAAVFVTTRRAVIQAYDEAELRKTVAADL